MAAGAACLAEEEVSCVGVAACVAAAGATGNRISGGKRFPSKKTRMEGNRMMHTKDIFQKVRWWNVVKFTPLAVFLLWTFGFTWVLLAEPPGQRTFSSAAEASRALFRAAQAGDEGALLRIFGSDGKEIISSGDAVEDKNSRDQFVRKYQEMNRL